MRLFVSELFHFNNFYCMYIYTGILSAVVAQTITTTDLQNGGYVCPDQDISLDCTTRGSTSIAWRSEEYIGDQLLFSAMLQVEGESTNSSSVPSTVATLTRKYTDNGVQVLESTLRIVPSLNHLNSTVTCAHSDSGTTDQFVVQVVGKYFSHNLTWMRIKIQ